MRAIVRPEATVDYPGNARATPDDATTLAYERTRVAYERTMLAWVRTATSLITFGFSISKFSDILGRDVNRSTYVVGANEFGLILVSMGLASLALATLEYRQNLHDLGTAYTTKRRSMAVIVAGMIAVLGIAALLAMIFHK
jgi:putative membrane protein